MNLSISNFESGQRMAVNWLVRFGITLVLLVAALMTVNYFYDSLPRVVETIQQRQLNAYKIFVPQRFDMVAYGSSRINYGIDPGSMQSFLPGIRIYNCALDGGSLNREIFDFLESRIDKRLAGPRIVLLELSPRVLWATFRINSNYRSMINKSPDEIRWLMNYTPEHRLWGPNLFTPMDRERWNQRRTRSIRRSISRYHLENGWREVVTISTNPEKTIPKYLHTLSTCFDMTKCDISKSLSETLEKTRDWSSRGVMVFGVEPPTDPRIKKLEEKLSGYDSAHVHELFREAGGIFIQITGNYPSTLDGSHLASEEAKAFSREVAQAIAAQCTLQHQ